MRIETALQRKARAVMQLRDLFSSAESFGMTSAALNERVKTIRETTLAKCPHWVHAHVDGYREALTDSLYRRSLMFGGFVDGRFYSTHRTRPDYYESNGIAPADFADDGRVQDRGHYWSTTSTPKPFFIREVTA